MEITIGTAGGIYGTTTQLAPAVALNVYLVKGPHYTVWIDSGVAGIFGQLMALMARAGVSPQDLRFVLHTHSHHDHIGCNGQLKQATGCLIVAHRQYAAWHTDFERHYQEFARPFPAIIPDTPDLRAEVLDILDTPHAVDLFVEEGIQFNLGDDISLRAYFLPGHMLAEFGWFESASRTLILGDAVTGLDWPIFHSHLTVAGYRQTLDRIAFLLDDLAVRQVLFAHFPPMTPAQVRPLLDQARAYIDAIEQTVLAALAAGPGLQLAEIWQATCTAMGRRAEFRALNMVHTHMQDLIARGLVETTSPQQYRLVR